LKKMEHRLAIWKRLYLSKRSRLTLVIIIIIIIKTLFPIS